MTVAEKISDGVSRRALLTAGLAGGFLLAFHLPVRAAVNEPLRAQERLYALAGVERREG